MKKFFEELADWVWIIMLLGVVFLFHGEPDVWDRLHDRAMGVQPKCLPEPQEAKP